MLRAIRIGLFIGTLVGMSACAPLTSGGPTSGPYGGVDAGASRR